MVPTKSNDHWTFLEEIEAPMWVDLTLEVKSNNENVDDKWFSMHHQIHQCYSDDLKSAFSQLLRDCKTLDLEIVASSSPNLPNSVSRSRGKDYDGKLKPRSSFTDSKGSSSTKSCLTKNTAANISDPLSAHGNLAIGPTQLSGPTSSLLSVMRRSLRKSCITRQASRVEVNNSRRESSGHRSYSSKSSVGSSSNPGFGVQSISSKSEKLQKKPLGTGNFSVMTQAAKNKTKSSKVSSTLVIQVDDMSSNSRRMGKGYSAKSGYLEASKPKMVHPKASVPQRRDGQNACLKSNKKVGLAGTGRSKKALLGKENAIVRNAASQTCDGRDPSTVTMVKDQKRTHHSVQHRVGKRSAVSSKGKNRDPSEGRNLKNANQTVYFR